MLTNQQSKQTFAFDRYLNRTDVYEYDFGTGATGPLVRRAHADFLTLNNGFQYASDNNIHIRSLPLQQTVYDGVGAERARTSYEYDNYTQGIASRPDISGHDPAFSPSYTTRGNVTQATKWLLPSTQLSSRMQYDEAGNLTSSADPMGRTTSFDYSDRFGSPDSEARSNTPPAELNGQTSYGFATRVTNPLGHIAYTQFDYYLGRAVNGEDANGVVASGSYADALDRATQLDVAVGTPLQQRTIYQYDDVARTVTTRSDLNNYADGLLRNEIIYDGLGRTVETRQYESSTAYIKTTQIYDGAGRVARSHNPHRTTSEDSYGWTETTYDGLSRARRIETFDRNGVSTGAVTTSYNDNQTTVTDQAGKKRRSVVDALGRLKQVDELNMDGTLYAATFYLYDTLDNLVRVTQGSQQRFFMYDSLSRLIRARNPEQNVNTALNLADPLTANSQWTMSYVYDENSNLKERIDARNIKTTYNYDLLNRVTSRTYLSDPQATPAVSYFYDNQSLPVGAPSFNRGSSIGRLVGMSYGGGSAGNYQGY